MSDSKPGKSLDSPRKVGSKLFLLDDVGTFQTTVCAFCIHWSWQTKGSTFQLNLTTSVVCSSRSLLIGGGCPKQYFLDCRTRERGINADASKAAAC